MNSDWELPHIITVKSSAGAGKTYNLALRYLQLLTLGNTGGEPGTKSHICNIVAITFTNKAASEMRSRIIDWMKRIILDLPFKGSSVKPVNEIITDASDFQGRQDLVKTVEIDFEDLIRNFYDFKVSTIDSFVNLTLKASAFKLGLPPDFDISTESALYVEAVFQDCLQEILEDRDVKRKFDSFLQAYIELEGENVAWIPKRFLIDTLYRFWKEEAKENKDFLPGPGPALLEDLRIEIAGRTDRLLASLRNTAGVKVHKGFLGSLENLASFDRSEFKGSAFYKRETIAESLNKGSAPVDNAWELTWQEIRAFISRYVETLAESKFSSYLEIYALFKERLRQEVTYRHRLILIEELNRLLQDVICGEDFIPEIYYALAERYSHFLIDEFQDTNHLQWKNIGILADEALSRGGTLFLVGDKKQAIYRWRGGKAELVDEISSTYPAYTTYPVCLDVNYRSGEHVVSFNNTLFDPENVLNLLRSLAGGVVPGDWDRIADTYQGSSQQCMEQKKGEGYVWVERLVLGTGDEETGEKLSKEEKEELTSDKVELLVKEIRGRQVYRDRDIAVLVRRREEAELIVKRLLEAGIAVDSEFTVNVKNNPLVKEMIGFLQFLSAPDDDAVLAGFLTGTIFTEVTGTGRKATIKWITKQRLTAAREPLYRAFRSSYALLWDRFFADFFKGAGYLPLYELFVLILKRWRILDRFPEDAPYFLHICEMITQREGMGSNNLTGFLDFWGEGAETGFRDARADDAPFLLKTTEGANAVRVLTIHKAKGLQFPVVILPFLKLADFGASDRRDKGKFFVSVDQGLKLLNIKKDYVDFSPTLKSVYLEHETDYLIDEINNLYVACTRAERELYVILTDSRRQKNYLIDYLFSIPAFQGYMSAGTMEIGRRAEASGEDILSAGAGTPRISDDLHFEAAGSDLQWMDKVHGKFESPEGCSKEQVHAKKRGDAIHYILSLIGFLPEDYHALLNESVHRAAARFGLQAQEEELRTIMIRFFSHAPFRNFFLPEEGSAIYREKELVDPRGDAYKPDRIIVRNDFVDVIDFKTGETRSPDHVEQISNYGRLLEMIHKDRPVRKHLLYMDENRLETI
jgi:ATP-dependent helicase/nuclease subunit A